PRKTPAEISEKLNREINVALADPKIKAQLADLGNAVIPGSPADFGRLIAEETEKWGKVIRAAKIKAESIHSIAAKEENRQRQQLTSTPPPPKKAADAELYRSKYEPPRGRNPSGGDGAGA